MGERAWCCACTRLKELCRREKPGTSPPASPSPPPPPPPEPEPEPEPVGGVWVSRWAFERRRPEELSFPAGARFNVVSRDGDWWSAQMLDRSRGVLGAGLVPANYLEPGTAPDAEPWYFGTMSRLEARHHLLAAGNADGAFMVRRSDKDHNALVLSVRSGSQVRHFRIHEAAAAAVEDDGGGGDGWVMVEAERRFPSLRPLLQHYARSPLGSCGMLGDPCAPPQATPPQPQPEAPDDGWTLPKGQFTLEERLGGGYFADVHRGRWRNAINVAIKVIRNDSEVNHGEFQREVQILKKLRHRHLIALFAVCTDSPPYYIITELMSRGSLLAFLRSAEGQQQEVMSLMDMGAQVADGMSYLEEHNSIHRDLAARNVLVGDDYICKVADFGLARIVKEPFYITADQKIPFKWSAPEAISHGKFSTKSDVWSFGVLLYEIITYGGIPYPALNNVEAYQQVAKGYRMSAPPLCPDFLYQIMLSCWSAEPELRPPFSVLRAQLESSYEFTSAASGGQHSPVYADSQRTPVTP